MTGTKTPAQLLIAAAWNDINVTEHPIGSNAGPRVNQMLANVNLGPGFYWCDAAVSTWGKEAAAAGGFIWPLPMTPDCDVSLDKARRLGILRSSDPQPGDVFLVLKPGNDNDAFHTGIVVKDNNDGTIETIEGNSNLDGSNNGYEVAHKAGNDSRRITSRLRFVRWQDLVKAAVTSWTVNVEGVKQANIWADPTGSVWAQAGPFVTALQHSDAKAKRLDYNKIDHNLKLDGHDLPVKAELRGGNAFARVRDLATAFGGTVLPVDNDKKIITVTRATGSTG